MDNNAELSFIFEPMYFDVVDFFEFPERNVEHYVDDRFVTI